MGYSEGFGWERTNDLLSFFFFFAILWISYCGLWYFPDSSVGKIIRLQCRRPWFNSCWKICWKRDRLPTPVFLGFPCGSASKKSAYSVGDLSSIPGLGRSSGEGKDYPLQYSGLENFSPLGYKELDRTEQFLLSLFLPSITKWLFFSSFFKFHLENNFAHL